MSDLYINNLIEKYKDRLFAIAFNYFKNSFDAEDIVQEVFIKLYKCKKDFENEDHIKNWLIRVTINECKKVLISPWFKRNISIEDYSKELSFSNPEESNLFISVMNLPKKYRLVIHLYYYENYSTKEIASILKIKETTVTTQLMRGRNMLKNNLMEEFQYEF